MKEYATELFYNNQYLSGKEPVIPNSDLMYWIRRATNEVRYYSFGRIDKMNEIPEDVQLCCCEVADKLYQYEQAKDSSGRVLQSYGNDGDSGTFVSSDLSEKAVRKSVHEIIRHWLCLSGLLYCGGLQ